MLQVGMDVPRIECDGGCARLWEDGFMRDGWFDHERLDVYQAARQFKRLLQKLLPLIPRGNADLVDQLRRAARSITSNIAEASGKWTTGDKAHYFKIARGSATECAAILDECVDYGFLADDQVRPALETLSRVVAMLIRIVLSLEQRTGGGSAPMTPPRPRSRSARPKDSR